MLGYEQTELLNRNLRTRLHPHDVQHVMAHIENPDAVNIEFVARYQKKKYGPACMDWHALEREAWSWCLAVAGALRFCLG